MKKSDIDWKDGRVTWWGVIAEFDLDKSLDSQIDLLTKDLTQVEYAKNIVLDLGWTPSFKRDGGFNLLVVENQDWENPIFKMRFRDFASLVPNLNKAIGFAVDRQSQK
ncbi:MAG TPA: hypothetical protein VG347_25190 [Verrucomicrobiae bacterium]|nr:hypothetical protein [Verrucomicrobiae bacterium]